MEDRWLATAHLKANSYFTNGCHSLMACGTGSLADEKLIARGRSVQVMFDYRTKETRPITDDMRARLVAFEGRPL